MGRSSIPPALIELANPTSPEAQEQALRNLKNEVVGHDQRKELAIRHGIVRPLVDILKAKSSGKRRVGGVTNGSSSSSSARIDEPRGHAAADCSSIEDEIRYHATLVVGSLAMGGPAFITPLLAGSVLPPLLDALSPADISPKLIVATLRTILTIVDAAGLERPWTDPADGPLRTPSLKVVSEHIYLPPVLESLADILQQPSDPNIVQVEQSLVLQLIVRTCREENERRLLLDSGILDTLAHKLAAIAHADARALRGEPREPSAGALPWTYLGDILECIGTIIQGSNYRAARFLYSAGIQNVFSTSKAGTAEPYEGDNGKDPSPAWERLLPRIHISPSKSDAYSKNFPPIGSFNSLGADNIFRLPSLDNPQQPPQSQPPEQLESPLVMWLIYVARSTRGRDRLAACWVLGLLKTFHDRYPNVDEPPKKVREKYVALLLIPLVAAIIENANPTSEAVKKLENEGPADKKREHRYILERAPLILATLISGDSSLQDAALNARALPVLCQTLKKSFDPFVTSSKPLWTPRPSSTNPHGDVADIPSSTLGKPGLSPDILHALRYRESSLLAIAAIADHSDHIRFTVIENGAVPSIIDSMKPYSESQTESSATNESSHNPVWVLIAALEALRSLSRSVKVLRTSLIDHNAGEPVFRLLTHSDVNVQVAATKLLINLVLDLSPLKQSIIDLGPVGILCDHCKSANFDLRLNSLWALKHLCLNAPFELKIKCLEELDVGWLVHIVSGELRDQLSILHGKSAVSTPLGMGTPNAAGEQVDILNAVDDPRMDVDEDTSSDEDEDTMTDSIGSLRNRRQRHAIKIAIRARLKQIKCAEQDPRYKAAEEDFQIQVQALDFIRNFLNEPKNAGPQIDHMLSTVGRSRFFEILDSKLKPRNGDASSWSNTSTATSSSRTRGPVSFNLQSEYQFNSPSNIPPTHPAAQHNEIVKATIMILIHISNGKSHHRTMLISQGSLMSHIHALCTHPDHEIRLACEWFLHNLLWLDDEEDRLAARERANQLRSMGFLDKIRESASKDAHLDVKERAKTNLDLITQLLGASALDVRSGGTTAAAGSSGGGAGGFGAAAGSESNVGLRGGLGGYRAWNRD